MNAFAEGRLLLERLPEPERPTTVAVCKPAERRRTGGQTAAAASMSIDLVRVRLAL